MLGESVKAPQVNLHYVRLFVAIQNPLHTPDETRNSSKTNNSCKQHFHGMEATEPQITVPAE